MARIYKATFEITPVLPFTISHEKPNPVPADMSLNITVGLSYTGAGAGYEEYFLEMTWRNPEIEGVFTSLINFSGTLPSAPNNRVPIAETGFSSHEVLLNFSPLDTAVNGSFATNVSFKVLGRNGVTFAILDSVSDNITANITGAGGGEPPVETIGIDPEALVFSHALDQALPPSKSVEVTSGGPFTVSVSGPIELSGPNLFLTGIVNGTKTYTGSTAQTINVFVSGDVSTQSPGAYEYLAVFSQTGSQSALIGTLAISLYLFENSDLVINPSALEFFAIKDIQEALSQTITVAGAPTFTLTRPSWLNVTPTTGQAFTDVTVTPNPTSALAVGTYEGVIVFSDGTNEYRVPVLHNVYGNVQLGVHPNKINFTDDFETISRFYEQINYRLLLNFAVDFFNYGSTLLNQTTLDYTLGFFNNRTKFFIGQTLNSIMKELLKLQPIKMDNLKSQISTFAPLRNYYLPAQVTMTALFKHDFDELQDKTYVFENIKFIKGRRPKTPFDDTFILDYYRDPLRVTVNSVAMFNFYKEKNHVFRIYTNGIFHSSISHKVGTQRIFGHKLSFSSYQQGDVVELRLYKNIDGSIDEAWFDTPANYISQKYIMIPEGKASHHIGYEDEHGLLKIIEFTGSITFENNYENTVAKNYEEFLETLKKLDSKKTRKAVINTGPIFEVNTKTIDALLGSKRAWLLSKEDKLSISMIPTNKTMIDQDTDQDLYSYDIEFEINFNNDFEINT